jgi:uncharacterized protein YbaP (TraB family)
MRRVQHLAAILLCCFGVSTVCAERVQVAPPAALERYDHGILWRIEKPGAAPSYAFGTIHIDDPRVLDLPPAVARAFAQSGSFTMEMLTDEAASRKFTRASRLGGGEDLPAVLGPELYRKVAQKMEARDVPDAVTRKLKPWSVMLTLLLPRERPAVILDSALYEKAVAQKKPVFQLETIEEQIATFDGMPMDIQVGLLESVVDHEDKIAGMTRDLIQAYLDRDLKRMWDINSRFTALDSGKESENEFFLERVLFARNRHMAASMTPRLRQGRAFIAVGALHLYGERGILSLLEQQGYRITRVY